MVNPQLLQYVRAQRTAGVSKEEIIKALAGGGWSAADAQEAFAAIDGPPAPPPTPKPLTPPAPAASAPASAMSAMSPAMQSRPVMTPVQTQPIQPVSMRPQPAAVVQPRSVYAPAIKRRAKWPWVLLFLILFFIFGMGAGAYLAVTNELFGSLVSGLAGVEQNPAENEDGFNMVANEGDEGGFLEVSPDPFDNSSLNEENSTSTPQTSTGTSTSTSTATTTNGQ